MTQEKLTLRLTSHLLLGVVRVHSKQIHYALRKLICSAESDRIISNYVSSCSIYLLEESEELLKRFNFLSHKFSINLLEKPRYLLYRAVLYVTTWHCNS